jgi:uncharacterized protein (DUF1778 family)
VPLRPSSERREAERAVERVLAEPKGRIVLRVDEETKRAIHARAAAKGEFVMAYILRLHEEDVAREEEEKRKAKGAGR